MRCSDTSSPAKDCNLVSRMQQIIFGIIVSLVVLAMFGLPVVSDQTPPPHAGTIIIGAG
jgi:hypothetical protein